MPAQLSLAADNSGRRRASRRTVSVSRATARGLGGTPGKALLLDLSIYGCRLAMAEPHAPGARLRLRLDGGWPIPATVVWADGERAGCRFDTPIATEVMRRFTCGGVDQAPRSRQVAKALS